MAALTFFNYVAGWLPFITTHQASYAVSSWCRIRVQHHHISLTTCLLASTVWPHPAGNRDDRKHSMAAHCTENSHSSTTLLVHNPKYHSSAPAILRHPSHMDSYVPLQRCSPVVTSVLMAVRSICGVMRRRRRQLLSWRRRA